MEPSLDEAMALQSLLPGEEVSVHVVPEFEEVQMWLLPTPATAASLVPSLDEVMPNQVFVLPTEVSSVHVAPESAEIQMFP